MFRHVVCYIITVCIYRFALTLPAKSGMTPTTTPVTEPHVKFDPVLGKMTPSQDIKEFVETVFKPVARDDDEYDPEDQAAPFNSSENSGEALKPVDPNNAAHVGMEQYWPGGDWVYRKAILEHCNNTVPACYETLGKYGKVCAGNHNLEVHTTFDTICDMFDINCRDGSFTTFTTTSNETIWVRIKPTGQFNMMLSSSGTNVGFIVTRAKNKVVKPRWTFSYGIKCWDHWEPACIQLDELREIPKLKWAWKHQFSFRNYLVEEEHQDVWKAALNNKRTRHWRVSWNETGLIKLTMLLDNGETYKDTEFNYTNADMGFQARYFGMWGGSVKEPLWWHLDGEGIVRGYMLAYRGRCRPDLPTLPTEQPRKLRDNLDIEMYNFAERMDEFGYNFSRVTGGVRGTDYYPVVEDDVDDEHIYG